MLKIVCLIFRFFGFEKVSIQRECMHRIQGQRPRWTEPDRDLYDLYIYLEGFVHHWKMGQGVAAEKWIYRLKYPASILNFYEGPTTLSSEQLVALSKRFSRESV